MPRRRVAVALLATATLSGGLPAAADLPYHTGTPSGTDVYDYSSYLFIDDGSCNETPAPGGDTDNDLPGNFDCSDDWKLSDDRTDENPDDVRLLTDPQELLGVKGPGLNRAWEVTTGRPDVVIAVLDSGIRWEEERASLLYKHLLNCEELPRPQARDGSERAGDAAHHCGYDVDGDTNRDGVPDGEPDGFFNVVDYFDDPRVTALSPQDDDVDDVDLDGDGTVEAHERGPDLDDHVVDLYADDANDDLDPSDVIRTFSDGVDDDGNGYVDDISGWDFFEDDNDPQDDTDYGHGTGEMEGSAAEVGRRNQTGMDGESPWLGGEATCPNCMGMSLRVGDSFIADVNHFAEAVVYAVDNGAMVVQEALGTLNHTSFGQEALDYAYQRGVIVNASEADEAAGHQNWPAAYDHTMVVNSIRQSGLNSTDPDEQGAAGEHSYLYFNGCTNFGGYTYVAIPSTSCSSDATGLSSGYSGLLQSAALNAIDRQELQPYPVHVGPDRYETAPFPLSAEEAMQLWRLAADDVDLASPCTEGLSDRAGGAKQPVHQFCDEQPSYTSPAPYQPRSAEADDYATGTSTTTRYQTVKGWDFFTGYGRSNAARLVRYLGSDGDEYVPDADGFAPFGVGTHHLEAEDRIPPEADITSPRWWHQYAYRMQDGAPVLLEPDDPSDPDAIVIEGFAAANRVTRDGGSFTYVVEWAPHVQGVSTSQFAAAGGYQPADGDEDSHGPWTEVTRVADNRAPVEGELGRIPIADVIAAQAANPNPFNPVQTGTLPEDPTSRFQPERFGIRLRVRVIAQPVVNLDGDPSNDDTVNNEAIRQKQVDVYEADEYVLRNDLGEGGRLTGGAGSPSFHDIDGDGVDELLIHSSDGLLHAYTDVTTGEELPGWPVRTDPYPGVARHATGDNAYTRGDIRTDIASAMLAGTPVVADLDDDGETEVLDTDLEGKLYAWNADGSRRFVTTVDYDLTREPSCEVVRPACDDFAPIDRRDRFNNRDWGFNMAPSVGDLDGDGDLEIVAGAGDGHVYVFDDEGVVVPGFPVMLRDPSKVASVNEVRRWVYTDPGDAQTGAKVLVTPSLGDLDGDGDLEIVVGVNEAYEEAPNYSQSDNPEIAAAGSLLSPGNTRIYALHHTGALTTSSEAHRATAHPHDQAYVEGWPVPIAHLQLELLPYVGLGTNSTAPLADFDSDGTLEIVTASVAGPGYVLNHDGTSFLGGAQGQYDTLATSSSRKGATSDATDFPSLIGVGGLAVGSMDGGGHLTIAGPGAGLKRLLDVALSGDQTGAEDHLNLWNPTDPTEPGRFEPNAPILVNDLQFFTPPIVADVTGDGNAEAIQGTATKDTVVVGLDDANSELATRYHTGGWHVNAAAVGNAPVAGADGGNLSLASITREGWLRLWPTQTPVNGTADCAALDQWPEFGHDPFNSSNHATDAVRPYPVEDLTADPLAPGERRPTLRFTAPGDDRDCGSVERYELRRVSGDVADPDWNAATPVALAPHDPSTPNTEDQVALGEDLPYGTHRLLLRARDDADNGSAVSTVVVQVTSLAPQVTIDGPSAVPTGTAVSYAATVTDPDQPAGPFVYDWTVTGGATITGDGTATIEVTWPAAAEGTQQTVGVVVTDDDGGQGQDQVNVNVGDFPGNAPPIAQAGPSTRQVQAGDRITFDGSGSADADGDDLDHDWSVDDPTRADPSTGTGETFTTSFADTGQIYDVTVTLQVSDGQATSQDTVRVTVVPNRRPTADAGHDQRVVEDRSLTFDGRGSADADRDPLTYDWSFGDGGESSGAQAQHTYDGPGTYTVTLTVTDEHGASDTDAASVVVIDEVALAGTGRIETAVEVSKHTQRLADDGFGATAVLARADEYPDALTGAPLARANDGPILLTEGERLSDATRAELERLGTTQVIVLGGDAAISPSVVDDLEAMGLEVERIGGVDRYDTARLVARRIGGDQVYVVEGFDPDPGRGWPDAVSVAPLAAEQGRAILLVTTEDLPGSTQRALQELDVTSATIVGGPVAVSGQVEQRLRDEGLEVTRIHGTTRYATAAAVTTVAAASGASSDVVWLATGLNYPDALAAGPAVPVTVGILLLVDGDDLANSGATRDRLEVIDERVRTVTFLGGPDAISPSVREQVAQVLEE